MTAGKVNVMVYQPQYLDRMREIGGFPIELGVGLSLGHAASVVLQCLPPVHGTDAGTPRGYGIAPPRGAEPIVKLAKTVHDIAQGRRVKAGANGVVGCMWRHGDRVVVRVFFRDGAQPNSPRIVTCYGDAIRSVRGLEGQIPATTGWQVIQLDP